MATKKYKRTKNGNNWAIYVPFCGYSLRFLRFPPKVMVAEVVPVLRC